MADEKKKPAEKKPKVPREKKTDVNTEHIGFDVTPELKAKFQAECKRQGASGREVLTAAVEKFIAK